MGSKKFSLITLSALGLLIFFFSRGQIIDSNCVDLQCRALGEYATYLWLLRDFSVAIFALGILNLIKPAANRALLILTAIAAVATIFAVISAPDISRNILSPFDKKFVGQLCAGVYLFVGVIIWLRAYWKNK